jgi:hypothetical protein
MMEAPLDAFVAQLMAQLQLQNALAAAHQAYAPTDEQSDDADVHLAVAKPYAPDDDVSTTSESTTDSATLSLSLLTETPDFHPLPSLSLSCRQSQGRR